MAAGDLEDGEEVGVLAAAAEAAEALGAAAGAEAAALAAEGAVAGAGVATEECICVALLSRSCLPGLLLVLVWFPSAKM